MQKKIILAFAVSIAGLGMAQEAPNETMPVTAEQAEAPEAIADQAPVAGTEPVSIPSGQTIEPAVSAAPNQTKQSQTSTVAEQTQAPVASAQPEELSSPAALQDTTQPVSQPEPKDTVAEPQPAPVSISQEQAPSVSEKQPEQPVTQLVPTVQPAQPEEPVEHAEELEIKGIDTIDITEHKGNWLYKRIWWEKAERTYEKIKQLAEKIQEARIIFFARRTDLDRNTLDPFYLGQGFSQGELTEIINFLTTRLEEERQEGTLDEKEQALLNTLSEEKKNLEILQKGVGAISNIDRALDDALLKLSEQLQQARNYEHQAWENFKAINRELSDKRARELYYGMDTYWRNLNNINTYISDAYSQYFDQLTDRLKQEIDKIKSTMDVLKEKGVDIQLQTQRLKTGKPTELEEEPEQAAAEPTGVFNTLWSWVKAPFIAIADMISGAVGWITGTGATEELTLARPERSQSE